MADILSKLIDNQREQALPSQEIKPFDGSNVLDYMTFMQNFKYVVENNTSDDARKLELLIKYTRGEAYELIKQCPMIVPAQKAFLRAKMLLHRDYGNEPILAAAFKRKAEEWNRISSGDRVNLRKFSLFLINCVNAKQGNSEMSTMDGFEFLKILASKLPTGIQQQWIKEVGRFREVEHKSPTLEDFETFVGRISRNENDPRISGLGYQFQNSRHKPQVSSSALQQRKVYSNQVKVDNNVRETENRAAKPPCLFCGEWSHHPLAECRRFGVLSSENKSDSCKKLGLCFACLNPGHVKPNCMNKEWAKCAKCPRPHPTILHDSNKDRNRNYSENPYRERREFSNRETVNRETGYRDHSRREDFVEPKAKITSGCLSTGPNPLMAIVSVRIKPKSSNESIGTYAFVDNGCGAVFIESEMFNALKVRTKKTSVLLKTLNLEKAEDTEIITDALQVSNAYQEEFIDLPITYVKSELPVSMKDAPTQEDLIKYEHFKDLVLPQLVGPCIPKVTLMIGVNMPAATTPLEIRTGRIGEPYAIKSPLGWLFYGIPSKFTNMKHISVNFCEVDNRLEDQLRGYFNLEFSENLSDDTKSLSIEDKCFLNIMDKSVKFVNNHYQTQLPFRDSKTVMPDNKLQAELFASKLRNRLINNTQLREQYCDFMKNLEIKGYAERVPDSELGRKDGRVWFIPHHNVSHPKKPDKTRVVYNCPLSYHNRSLNDELLQGPDLTNRMIGVLLRWRQEPIAMTADIESMFYQVRVEKDNRDMMRFLWWPSQDLSNPLTEYRMCVHLFGAVSSPSCANYALRKAASDNIRNYRPEVIEAINNDFYVDDFLKSVKSEGEAIELVREICDLLKRSGFNLTKWVSNSRELLNTIPDISKVDEVKNLDLTKDSLPVKRALGVQWCTETDKLKLCISEMKSTATRRNILSVMGSVYDPYGICSPFVLKARIILQELCREKLSWDQPIPSKYELEWSKWLNDLPNLQHVELNRCIKPQNFGNVMNIQIHHLVDASQDGYGTVTYIRLINSDGLIHCSFLMGRSRVAPIKPHSIVKLELAAATSAVKQNNMLNREMTLPVNDTYYWTDSQTVLKYICNEKARYQVYVANRIALIRDGSSIRQWRYIPSELNCADYCSRGLTTAELTSTKWLKGPTFLWKDKSNWPENCIELENSTDLETTVYAVKLSEQSQKCVNQLFEHYSNYNRLKRGVAWWLRLKNILYLKSKKCEIPKEKLNSILESAEIETAESEIIKFVQREHFPSEIEACERNKVVNVGSDISNLDPFVKNELLCVGGRLRNAKIPESAKHQLILPKNCHVSNLIVRHAHASVLHQGRNHTLSYLRQKYWIVKSGVLVKDFVNKCVICRRQHQRKGIQKMADLPANRLRPDEPAFTCVGIDYFGPLEVKIGRSVKKRYGVVFTCLSSRAIHREIAESLDTSSCIDALRRFIARRGSVKVIYSDNGTILVGTYIELKEALKTLDQHKLNRFACDHSFEWIFNPPTASHFGGIWERQIRTIRQIMQCILSEQFIKTNKSEEQLRTLFCEIESVINSRPLTRVSEDSNDLEFISPNSLLLLRPPSDFPIGVFCERDVYSRRRWRQVQYMADLFWRRWTKEYMPALQTRQKWTHPKRSLRVDDIVLIVDDSAPRGSWPMGRVVEIYKDKNGLVRSVKLKTKTTFLVRPIAKLCLILEQDLD